MSRAKVRLGDPRPLVPGPAVVDGIEIGNSNNNLDLIRHHGRLVLAWRSAPTHFASAEARLHVVSSTDGGRRWHHEHTVAMDRDVREPRLFVWDDSLRLAWFSAGTTSTRFEPDRIWISAEEAPGTWSEAVAVSPPDHVAWRIRPLHGRLAMSIYRGASTLYGRDPQPLSVELWGSDDGWVWAPWNPDRPEVHAGGSESEFIELPDARLLAVVRKEGPTGGFGSDVAVAPADDPTSWTLQSDDRKFDSPYLFLDGDQPYLIARRQLAFGGRFDIAPRCFPPGMRIKLDQAAYWLTAKRASVYAVNVDTQRADWLIDLPSAGDTAFAASVPTGPGRHLVVNYSSPTLHRWWPWMVGQLRPTAIHAVELTITTDP